MPAAVFPWALYFLRKIAQMAMHKSVYFTPMVEDGSNNSIFSLTVNHLSAKLYAGIIAPLRLFLARGECG